MLAFVPPGVLHHMWPCFKLFFFWPVNSLFNNCKITHSSFSSFCLRVNKWYSDSLSKQKLISLKQIVKKSCSCDQNRCYFLTINKVLSDFPLTLVCVRVCDTMFFLFCLSFCTTVCFCYCCCLFLSLTLCKMLNTVQSHTYERKFFFL